MKTARASSTHTLMIWRAGQRTTHQISLPDGPGRYWELERLTYGADAYLVSGLAAAAGGLHRRRAA